MKKYAKPYVIIHMILLILLGLSFLTSIWHLFLTNQNQVEIFTVSNIGSHLVCVLWILLIEIIYLLFSPLFQIPLEKKYSLNEKEKLDVYQQHIEIEQIEDSSFYPLKKKQLWTKIILIVFIVLSAFITFLYAFQVNAYSQSGNKLDEMISLAKKMIPWIVTLLLSIVAYFYLNDYYSKRILAILKTQKGKKKEMTYKKNERMILIIRLSILSLSILFIVLGIFHDGFQDTLKKAIQICLECIGIG